MTGYSRILSVFIAFFVFAVSAFSEVVLIPKGASWKMYDKDGEPPAGWQAPGFNDSSWQMKKSPLLISQKETAKDFTPIRKKPVYYFRIEFETGELDKDIVEIELYARIDIAQGLQAFLNGTQVDLRRLPENPTSNTFSIDQGNEYRMYANTKRGISPALVKKGKNVLAFSIHLKSLERENFGDDGFDVKLTALSKDDNHFMAGPIVAGTYKDKALVTLDSRFSGTVSAKCWLKDQKSETVEAKSEKSQNIHRLCFTNLKPFSDYVYTVSVKSDCGGKSLEFADGSFRTAPAGPVDKFTFGLWGDSRTYPEDWMNASAKMLKDDSLMFTVCTGDFVASGSLRELWEDEFFAPAKGFFSKKAVWPTLGNHDDQAEYIFDLFPECGVKGKGMFYTFVYGNVRFIAIDTNGRPGKGLAPKTEYGQYEFVEETLKNAREPYVFVFGHVSPFTSGYHGEWDKVKNQPKEQASRDLFLNLVPLFEKYKISGYFGAHTHMYERLMRNDINYIVSAGAGANLYDVREKSPFQVKQLTAYHYVRFTVSPEKITGEAISIGTKNNKSKLKEDGVIFDTFEIKPRSAGK